MSQLSYKEIAQKYFDSKNNLSKQLEYCNDYVVKGKKEGNNLEIAKGNYMISLLYNDNRTKVKYLDSVIKYSKNNTNKNFPARIYSEKAYLLKKEFKYEEALDNFILAEKYALKNNIDFYYNVRQSIAILKSENLGEVEEAMGLYHECYRYYKTKNFRIKKYNPMYLEVLFDIADAHNALFKTDSAAYYNRLGYRESRLAKDTLMQNLFVLNEGANLVLKKKYTIAIDSINKALPVIMTYKNIGNILASYYCLGKAFEGLDQKELALKNFIKVDSIYKIKGDINPEFVSGYPFIISYYKEKNNKVKQLQYLTTYMTIDSTIHKNYKELTKKLENEYDRPHFVKDKETLITNLRGNQHYYFLGIIGLLFLVFGAIYYGIQQRNMKKTYRSRFEKIIANTQPVITTATITEYHESENNKNKPSVVGDEMANQLLKKIDVFVNSKGYLKSNISLESFSKELETNKTYLSYLINQYKGKNFTQFINDLRIDDAIFSLQQQDYDLKKYNIQYIASRSGFNNAESFSNAFNKRTGLKPSFFIKELQKDKFINN